MLRRIQAKLRAINPLGCYLRRRTDLLRGWKRWRVLDGWRRAGCVIDPSIEVRYDWAARGEPLGGALDLVGKLSIDKGCIFWLGEIEGARGRIRIGERCYVGPYTFMGSCHELVMGDFCMIGAHSYLITANHGTARRDIPYARQGYTGGPIRLGNNVWLGCHVVVLPGVTIGDNAIVGAGAVVTQDIPAGECWGGVPARPLPKQLQGVL